jgi:hypothetical protein
MAKSQSHFAKIILYIVIAIAAVVIGLILFIVISFNLSERHDKQSIEAAVHDLVPSNYLLVSSVYDKGDIDNTPNAKYKYKLKDGVPLTKEALISKFQQLSYTYHGDSWSKEYKGKEVYITPFVVPPDLALDVSLGVSLSVR